MNKSLFYLVHLPIWWNIAKIWAKNHVRTMCSSTSNAQHKWKLPNKDKHRCLKNNVSLIEHGVVDVKDSFDGTLVHDDSSAKAHKVILVALNSFFSNFVIIPSINRVSYPNAINYYTLTQGHRTERSFEQRQHWQINLKRILLRSELYADEFTLWWHQ